MYDLRLDSSTSSLTLDEICTPSLTGILIGNMNVWKQRQLFWRLYYYFLIPNIYFIKNLQALLHLVIHIIQDYLVRKIFFFILDLAWSSKQFLAKLKAGRSRLSLDIKEPSLSKTPISTRKQIRHSASQLDSVSSFWKRFSMRRGRNQPLVACNQCPSCMEKICWYLACFIAIGEVI